MTPGPVLSSATFIGYLVAGWQGAIISTVSIFLPSFIIVSLLSQIIPKLRSSPVAQAFMQGVNAAVVALILSISLSLFRAAIVDLWTLIILLFGLVLLIRTHVDTFAVVLGGAFAGMIRYLSLGIVK
jgi:chromate transporter